MGNSVNPSYNLHYHPMVPGSILSVASSRSLIDKEELLMYSGTKSIFEFGSSGSNTKANAPLQAGGCQSFGPADTFYLKWI